MIELVDYKLRGPSEGKALRDIYQLINQVRARIVEDDFHMTLSIPRRVESLERNLIDAALHKTDWNITEAAEVLEISRVGLHGKLKRYGIESRL